ncbi:MAG TPA: PepSY domain-containing protein [Paracoccus sp. (in: a-proteobacteria)]|uniref:PepSY domain-containing protein n=1 Tax=uncultured Paracoccus sp. TaxID=189685 RepID=UPI00262B8239|nr:PepSY domain-containing protein [uncultured Paracoccus sp.]HMQ40706.1 PepSY domain-containing protein [Paracoccus sp. (in: a-proteobacteria)]HMR37125.1 PepSY domain-containing protein [Paracoccus sp. (in: a-proteobacteria)]
MIRRFHSLPALALGLFLTLIAASGAYLSVQPTIEHVAAPSAAQLSIGDATEAIAIAQPGLQALSRSPNGVLSAQVRDETGIHQLTVDPATGAALPEVVEGPVMRWIKGFHRSLQLGDAGRAAVGIMAGVMALIAGSGLWLLARSLGGWNRLGGAVRTGDAKGWHARIGRAAVVGLALSSLTGVWLSAASFGFVPDDSNPPLPMVTASAETVLPLDEMAGLAAPLETLRELRLPARAGDVILLESDSASAQIDPASGQVLAEAAHGLGARIWEWAYRLHTGHGLWLVGLALGLVAAMVPVLAGTGTTIWLSRRLRSRRIPGNIPMDQADLVILTGSEGGSTRGFAASLHKALTEAGRRVHLGEMNDLGAMPRAEALILMTATYGDGTAPASANGFLDRLGHAAPLPVAVLGFGDRAFPAFCGYAETVLADLTRHGWPRLMPMGRIDRQSPAEFNAWGRDLGRSLGLEISPEHRPTLPRLSPLSLISRRDYGEAVQAPSAILRFGIRPWWLGGPRFKAGDLLGVMAPGATAPRFYSLASSSRDGFAEICVRKVPGGICSTYLYGLGSEDSIRAFIRPNPAFRAGEEPLVMVASGCGVGPMAGLLRSAAPGAERSLYFGLRHPESDFLYREELANWHGDGRLTRLNTAYSRRDRRHVQHSLREDAARLSRQILAGARVLVCGSVTMGRAVAAELDAILAPAGLSVATLKQEGRYVEDIY